MRALGSDCARVGGSARTCCELFGCALLAAAAAAASGRRPLRRWPRVSLTAAAYASATVCVCVCVCVKQLK